MCNAHEVEFDKLCSEEIEYRIGTPSRNKDANTWHSEYQEAIALAETSAHTLSLCLGIALTDAYSVFVNALWRRLFTGEEGKK